LQPLIKELVDIGSRFIGFRDEAESLRSKFLITGLRLYCIIYSKNVLLYSGDLHLAEERARYLEKRAKDLEKELKASEKTRLDADVKAATVDDLRDRLHLAETALSQKEEHITQRESGIIARLKMQSNRFSSNVPVFSHYCVFYFLKLCLYVY
jgi:hypothetical protein